MESLKFDQQKAIFKKEEIENYYITVEKKVNSYFD